jgi:DNA end-binding protein Ku
MARAIWSGSISFGLVNIPVKLYNAVSRKSVSFNQLEAETGARIKYKKVSAETGDEVPADKIVKGYEIAKGQYVVIEEDELHGLDPEAVRTVDIAEFIDLDEIDPIFYDSAYYLAPDGPSGKAYGLLAKAMEDAHKVGIATFVMRTKKYLAAVRPKDGKLLLSTMVYADEVVDPQQIPEFDVLDGVELPKKELDMAKALIESLAEPFEPGEFRDDYRDAVLDLIERKASGEEIVAAPALPSADKVVDLMAALEASVAAAKKARTRHPTARDEADEDAPAAKPRKRKSA